MASHTIQNVCEKNTSNPHFRFLTCCGFALWKIVTYMMLDRTESTLEFAQPAKQHGFRTNHQIEEHVPKTNLVLDRATSANILVGIIPMIVFPATAPYPLKCMYLPGICMFEMQDLKNTCAKCRDKMHVSEYGHSKCICQMHVFKNVCAKCMLPQCQVSPGRHQPSWWLRIRLGIWEFHLLVGNNNMQETRKKKTALFDWSHKSPEKTSKKSMFFAFFLTKCR